MAVTVTVYVPDPDGVLATYGAGALVRLERAQTEITTLAVVSGTRTYTYLDTAGSSTSSYRTRYSNAAGTITSEYSATWRPGDIRLYAEPAEVAARLGLATTPLDDLWPLCREVSEWIETVTGRILAPDPDTVYVVDGWNASDDGRVLYFPRGIVSLTSVEVAPYTGAAFVAVPSTDWFLQPSPERRLPGWPVFEVHMTNIPSPGNTYPRFYPGYGTVRLTGQFGWPVIPEDIREVALRLAVALYRDRAAGGTDTVTIGEDGSRTISRLLSTRDWQTVQRYRVKAVSLV